jgi:hypothetical protein
MEYKELPPRTPAYILDTSEQAITNFMDLTTITDHSIIWYFVSMTNLYAKKPLGHNSSAPHIQVSLLPPDTIPTTACLHAVSYPQYA